MYGFVDSVNITQKFPHCNSSIFMFDGCWFKNIFWLNRNREFIIILMNANRNFHSLVYTFITPPSFPLIVILKQHINFDLT